MHVAVSVTTIGELQLGVLAAVDHSLRARCADTLARAQRRPIPIREAIMVTWARLVTDCRAAGIQRTVKLTDALIAATAVERGLPIVTQDDDPVVNARGKARHLRRLGRHLHQRVCIARGSVVEAVGSNRLRPRLRHAGRFVPGSRKSQQLAAPCTASHARRRGYETRRVHRAFVSLDLGTITAASQTQDGHVPRSADAK